MKKSKEPQKTKQTSKTLKLALALIVTVMAFSSVALAASGAGAEIAQKISDKAEGKKDAYAAVRISKLYSVSKEEALRMKEELGDWGKVAEKLSNEGRNPNALSQAKMIELYNQGYTLQDIYEAQGLVTMTGKSIEELLQMKGKAAPENSTTWSDIRNQLSVTAKPIYEVLGITKEKYEELQAQGLSPAQIDQVYTLAKVSKKDADEIAKKVKEGKTLEQINEENFAEVTANMSESEKNNALEARNNANKKMDENLKKALNISDEEYDKCVEAGLTDVSDIIMANQIVKNSKVSIEKVLELKKNIGNWKDVYLELEVSGVE